jgi:hypothetical protein
MYKKTIVALILFLIAKAVFAKGCAETHNFDKEVNGINWALKEIVFGAQPEVPKEMKFKINRLSLQFQKKPSAYSLILEDNELRIVSLSDNYYGKYEFVNSTRQNISIFDINYDEYYECLIETGKINDNLYLGFIKNTYQWTIYSGKLRLFTKDANKKSVYMDFSKKNK